MPLFLREADVDQLLPVAEAIQATELGFRLLGTGGAVNHPRQRGRMAGAVLNVMWALAPNLGAMGIKTYPIVRTDVTRGSSFTFVQYGFPHGDFQALLEADRLGQRRTGAATAVASRYLAREDSEVLALFGTGWQAESQLECLIATLPKLRQVFVVGRSQDRRDAFVDTMAARVQPRIETATARQAVTEADVIATATGSASPVYSGEWIRPGTHINAIGSNVPEKRELDKETIQRADRIVVDSADVARLESGDLIQNDFDWRLLEELGPIVAGNSPGRRDRHEITLFESQGLAIEDLACSVSVVKRAKQRGIGWEFPNS